MTPEQYFHDVAEPTVDEFMAEPTCVRRALLACMACYHVIDALAVRRRRTALQVYNDLLPRQPKLRVIKAVALLAKHVEPTQPGFNEVRSEHLRPASGAAFSDGSYYSDGSTHAGTRKVVVLRSPGFSKSDLTHALQDAMVFLKEEVATS